MVACVSAAPCMYAQRWMDGGPARRVAGTTCACMRMRVVGALIYISYR